MQTQSETCKQIECLSAQIPRSSMEKPFPGKMIPLLSHTKNEMDRNGCTTFGLKVKEFITAFSALIWKSFTLVVVDDQSFSNPFKADFLCSVLLGKCRWDRVGPARSYWPWSWQLTPDPHPLKQP